MFVSGTERDIVLIDTNIKFIIHGHNKVNIKYSPAKRFYYYPW